MAKNLKPQTQLDFSGGLNAVSTPYGVTAKQVQAVRNMTLDQHQGLRTRDGYTVVTTGPTTDPIVYVSVFANVAGSVLPFAITKNSSTGAMRIYRTDVNPWTSYTNTSDSTTFWTNTDPLPPESITIGNLEFIARGYLVPLIFDGSSYGQIGALSGQTLPPGAKHVAYFHGYIWIWNTAAVTTALDGPSSIRVNDPVTGITYPISGGGTAIDPTSSWPSAGQTFISRDDGEEGQGLAVYTTANTGISPLESLIAFKDFSAYQITGVFDVTGVTSGTINIQKIKSDMGCIAPRTIEFLTGFGIVRLAHKGFALYDGQDDRLISEEIRPYIFGSAHVAPINMMSANRSWAGQASNPPLYICACPVSGNTLTRIFVYDLVRRAWTICDFPDSFASVCNFQISGFAPEVRAGSATNGKIYSIFNGGTSDAGALIAWSARTRPFYNTSPTQNSYWRRAIIDLEYTPTQTVTVTPTYDGYIASTSQSLSYAIPSSSATALIYGSGLYGTGTYGSNPTSASSSSADLLRTAPVVDLTISGTGNVVIRAVTVHSSPKPLTRLVY